MKPLKYIEFVKDEIYINSHENFIPENESDKIYQALKTIISDLSSVRSSESRTEQVLATLKQLPDNEMCFIQSWLLKAIQDDDTFAYAYTDLAQMYNRRGGFLHPIKVPTKVELYELLEKEKQEEKYNFEKVKKHLETLPNTNSKIKYLTEIETEYLQNKTSLEIDFGTTFDQQCELEIKKLKTLLELEFITNPPTKQIFQLSKRKGAKTDLIRILNAVYELRLIDKVDGQTPGKQEFIEAFGGYLGIDLSGYHTNLSQALKNQPLEVNLKVFEEMKSITQKAHYINKI